VLHLLIKFLNQLAKCLRVDQCRRVDIFQEAKFVMITLGGYGKDVGSESGIGKRTTNGHIIHLIVVASVEDELVAPLSSICL
jgi:hypothetical protein